MSFDEAQLRTKGKALLKTLSGLGVVALLAIAFTELLDDVLEGDGLVAIDHPAASWLAEYRADWLTDFLLVVTRWGNPTPLTLVMTVVCTYTAYRAKSWLPIWIGALAGGGLALVITIAKHLVGRPRPPQPLAVIPANGLSFPSGHATGAAAVGVLCAWMLCRWVVRQPEFKGWVWTLAVTLIFLVGFSRPYLGVHFVTDVVAGWVLGVAWARAVIVLASRWLDPRAKSSEEATPPELAV